MVRIALIRSLTIHASFVSELGVRDSADKLNSIINGLREVVSKLGVNVWSYRVALPPNVGVDYVLRLYDDLCRDGVLIAAYHSDIKDAKPQDVVDVLRSCERSYVTLRLSSEANTNYAVGMYLNLTKAVDLDDFTRIGISIPNYVETPYFPLATAYSNGFSIALRYVDLVREYLIGSKDVLVSFMKLVNDLATLVTSSTGMEFLGIDYSLSPWASESVTELAEILSGVKFALPGSGWALSKLNDVIKEVMGLISIKGLGFNEVMLPVAEDDLLKVRVAEGLVTLRDLTYLTTYCLAGVDMVVVKDDLRIIKGVIKDVLRSTLIKGKVLGVRLIPVGLSEGSEVILKRFGRVSVIKY